MEISKKVAGKSPSFFYSSKKMLWKVSCEIFSIGHRASFFSIAGKWFPEINFIHEFCGVTFCFDVEIKESRKGSSFTFLWGQAYSLKSILSNFH